MRACYLLLLLALSASAHAHRFAPSLLQLTESGADRVAVTWKTPIQQVSDIPMGPSFPIAARSGAIPVDQGGNGQVTPVDLLPLRGTGRAKHWVSAGPNQSSVMLNLSLAVELATKPTADDPRLGTGEPDPWQVVGRCARG